jgi:hypothetical protein
LSPTIPADAGEPDHARSDAVRPQILMSGANQRLPVRATAWALPPSGENDFDPVPDFEPVGSKATAVTFKAENDDGDPINARIYVGHYEARASPIADTNPTTTGPINLDDTAKFAPAKYEFVAHAPATGVPSARIGSTRNNRADGRDRVPDSGVHRGNRYDAERRGDSRGLIDDTRARGDRNAESRHADAGITGGASRWRNGDDDLAG